MLESEKVNKSFFKEFFLNNHQTIFDHMVETLTYFFPLEETYMVERDSLVVSILLKFFKKLLTNVLYFEFRSILLNNPFFLKIVLIELNHECHKIRLEALTLLHEFFIDIENLEPIIHTLLLDNKSNFYQMFELNTEVFTSIDSNEKKNFILCELERIDTL